MRATIKRKIVLWNTLQINAQPDVGIIIRKEIVLGRNRLVPDSLGDQVSAQHLHIGDIEPQGADHLVILGMNRARGTEK